MHGDNGRPSPEKTTAAAATLACCGCCRGAGGVSDVVRWLEVLLRPLQILQRCPACYKAEGAAAAAAGKAEGMREVLRSCPRHVRRRRGNRAADRSLQLLQRIPVEPGDKGEMVLLRQGAGASRRGEEELLGGSRGTARTWSTERASAQTCCCRGRQSPRRRSKSR